jgi:nucleotide-binding universal stress UspA family protein
VATRDREEAVVFQRILVGTDFSPASTAAVEQAMKLATEVGSQLLIANVCNEQGSIEMSYAPERSYEQWRRAARTAAEGKVEPLAERARSQGLNARAVVLAGSPGEAILEAAKREAADLIVIGTRGLKGAERFFLGSVASRIVSASTCPVVTVRAPKPDRSSSLAAAS